MEHPTAALENGRMVMHDEQIAPFPGTDPDLTPAEDTPLTVPQLVARIHALAPRVRIEYLAGFSPPRLAEYLDHLVAVQAPRTGSGWVRRGDTSAMMVREARE